MLERNKIYCIDVLEGLKQLDDESVDVIITSPRIIMVEYMQREVGIKKLVDMIRTNQTNGVA